MYSVARALRHKAKLIEMLGGKCVCCGTTKQLEFDHIDPAIVSFRIGRKLGTYGIDILIAEAKKCQLLCTDCHLDKTLKENGKNRAIHGSAGMYSNHGCRCQMCRSAWAKLIGAYRAKLKECATI